MPGVHLFSRIGPHGSPTIASAGFSGRTVFPLEGEDRPRSGQMRGSLPQEPRSSGFPCTPTVSEGSFKLQQPSRSSPPHPALRATFPLQGGRPLKCPTRKPPSRPPDHVGIPDSISWIIRQSLSTSPRSMTSSGLRPENAGFGVPSQGPIASGRTTRANARCSRWSRDAGGAFLPSHEVMVRSDSPANLAKSFRGRPSPSRIDRTSGATARGCLVFRLMSLLLRPILPARRLGQGVLHANLHWPSPRSSREAGFLSRL